MLSHSYEPICFSYVILTFFQTQHDNESRICYWNPRPEGPWLQGVLPLPKTGLAIHPRNQKGKTRVKIWKRILLTDGRAIFRVWTAVVRLYRGINKGKGEGVCSDLGQLIVWVIIILGCSREPYLPTLRKLPLLFWLGELISLAGYLSIRLVFLESKINWGKDNSEKDRSGRDRKESVRLIIEFSLTHRQYPSQCCDSPIPWHLGIVFAYELLG